MSNIAKAFEHGKAFIPFITCGYPDLETTEKIVYAMVDAGADLIELGIPFSDPTAEGPVIQEANIRALTGVDKVTTDKVFDLVRRLRQKVTIPMVFMTYANVVFSYGSERFISTCKEIGIDGLILPDIPYEEKEEFDLQAVWSGSCIFDRADFTRTDQHDREGSKWIRLLCFFARCNRNKNRDYNQCRRDGRACEESEGHSLRNRIRNLNAGAGKEDGCLRRWRHRWKCDREDHRKIRTRGCTAGV